MTWPALVLDTTLSCSFRELSAGVAAYVSARLADAPPERLAYVMGEGAGAVLALHLALKCR